MEYNLLYIVTISTSPLLQMRKLRLSQHNVLLSPRDTSSVSEHLWLQSPSFCPLLGSTQLLSSLPQTCLLWFPWMAHSIFKGYQILPWFGGVWESEHEKSHIHSLEETRRAQGEVLQNRPVIQNHHGNQRGPKLQTYSRLALSSPFKSVRKEVKVAALPLGQERVPQLQHAPMHDAVSPQGVIWGTEHSGAFSGVGNSVPGGFSEKKNDTLSGKRTSCYKENTL